MWQRLLLARRPAALRPSFSRLLATDSSRRILCVDVPEHVAETSCVQELVQRGHVVDQVRAASDEYLTSVVKDYDALLAAPGTKLPRELLRAGAKHKLQLVAVPAASIPSEDIDLMEATNQGVMLLQLESKQVGDRSSVEAEIGLSLLIQLARHLPRSMACMRSGEPFDRQQFAGTELAGKSLGVVGIGQAGRRVVNMAHALGLQVFGFDPNLNQEAAELMGVKCVSMDELYATCDFITFHAPLTARTRGMFGDEALEKCKPGVKIVSVAEYRGSHGLLDENTLLRGLESGKISGVALDLLQSADGLDMSPTWQELMKHENVITRAHADGTASDDVLQRRKYRLLAENVGDALAQRYYRGVANGVFMPLTLLPEMKPFLELSESLGRFVHQLALSADPKDRITNVFLAATGGLQIDITTPQARQVLQNALLKGMLESMREYKEPAEDEEQPEISLLNSSLLAMAKGIDVRQGDLKTDPAAVRRHLKNCLAVVVETKNKDRLLVKGSVFGEDPRIVRVNEYSDFPAFRPKGNILVFNNEDVPGAIAGILSELSEAKINIANFGLARQNNVEHPLGILALDSVPSDETLNALKELPSVRSVRFAQV
ncbi:phosphoglycerate dehydrogenase [Phytophthora nicotianae CJ01A1]|uniref:D-3-phosphoglycerate dehydrogenase n=5 Tax=Phytophthora nicotianae TaxID=4792 RepID=W2Q864_PHYN3|nr:phosphoglycerate dehydrogenase [Phytophthora nicotianae INRA-310]ETI46302.1 phosphoglycerate dehydrogenase [Phytophthora nicotianae P1569]ETK86235.1 phosphoglycerate dehydrogenase [Phytophthora nicotianae]ETO74998.1 phosphoglycerate dehydrogenase [Phytophthora nicotianae P1976]ETP16111.1 phosphoglycerate dehydrogenase [Phytophthora nicotianae CJ01A1]KUF81074.1 D-3-phosphoglycerate dehydrogenase [Phytophthora nicotianae]